MPPGMPKQTPIQILKKKLYIVKMQWEWPKTIRVMHGMSDRTNGTW